MAVVWAFRVAVALAPLTYRVVKTNGGDLQSATNIIGRYWSRITDAGEDPDLLSLDMSPDPEGMMVSVADFTGSLDIRRVGIRFSRAPAGGITEDQAQVGLHFLKVTSGAAAAWVNGTHDATVEGLWNTLWGSIKVMFPTTTHLDVYRWYVGGPTWDVTPAPYNPAYRTTEVDVAGTGTGANLPPQCAVSITFKTSVRKRWGRLYLPAPTVGLCSPEGRLTPTGTTSATALNTAFGVFLNGCTSAGIQPVVVSRAHDAYTTEKGHAIAAQPYTAYGISGVQVDDIYDVIRSRRYSAPTNRYTTVITPAA